MESLAINLCIARQPWIFFFAQVSTDNILRFIYIVFIKKKKGGGVSWMPLQYIRGCFFACRKGMRICDWKLTIQAKPGRRGFWVLLPILTGMSVLINKDLNWVSMVCSSCWMKEKSMSQNRGVPIYILKVPEYFSLSDFPLSLTIPECFHLWLGWGSLTSFLW